MVVRGGGRRSAASNMYPPKQPEPARMPPSFLFKIFFFLFLNVRVKFACEFDPEKKQNREGTGGAAVGGF